MKKTVSIIIALLVVVVATVLIINNRSANRAGDLHTPVVIPDNARPISDGVYTIAPDTTVQWASNKTALLSWIDSGSIQLPSGSVLVAGGVPVAGTLEFDMSTITASATGQGSDSDTLQKLTDHLKSVDWFNVARHPKSVFVLTSAVASPGTFKYTVTGRLTMRDITADVTFDAHIYDVDGNLVIHGSADVDRTLWDIRFGSSKFFADIGDQAISDTFVVNYNITAKKNQ